MEFENKILPAGPDAKSQKANSIKFVHPLERLAAYLLDGSLAGIFALSLIAIAYLFKSKGLWSAVLPGAFWLVFAVSYASYFILMGASRFKGSLGKHAYGIKITDQDGRRLDLFKSTIHFFTSIALTSILFLSWIKAFKNKRNRTIHDSLAGTVAIQRTADSTSKKKLLIGLISGFTILFGICFLIIKSYSMVNAMNWKDKVSIKIYLNQIIESNRDIFDYVDAGIKSNGKFPKHLPNSLNRPNKDQKYHHFGYMGDQGRIIINMRLTNEKRATLLLEPKITKEGAVRWYCGSSRLTPSDLPKMCHNYEMKY